MKRRDFLATTAGTILVPSARAADKSLEPVETLPPDVTRVWLGRAFWANRLDDWRLREGRMECLRGTEPGFELRTVALLTRDIVAGPSPGHLSMRAGLLEDKKGGGFCGFLLGVGQGRLDHKAAALAQRASGEGGGFLCTYETDGKLRFREHTDEQSPLTYAELPSEVVVPAEAAAREVLLTLDLQPEPSGFFSLTLSAFDTAGGLLGRVVRRRVPDLELVGGISLASSAYTGKAGARWALADLRTGGAKVARHPERAFGPILGTLHSLNGRVLKMSAQLAPVGDREPQEVRLQWKPAGAAAWQDGPVARLQPGYVALFRVDGWDATRDHEYRVVYGGDSYAGTVRKDPGDKVPLTIGLLSCIIPVARNLEDNIDKVLPPQTERLGRYTASNLYFPHRELTGHVGKHKPDLLVFAGDQFYEGSPTRKDPSPAPVLDYLYKWYLWVWSFRKLTRDTPAILLVDDHDVFQGNLWGNGGRAAPQGDQNHGGYVRTADFVNLVQRTQCGHDPDPFDPRPVDQGIAVTYGAFRFGGVSFAVLEDRKWKTSPIQGSDLDVFEAQLLGERQERFLEEWRGGGDLRICLTQTLFGCLQTSPSGKPLMDWDSNGFPKLGRDRAVDLLKGSLILGGDQHLASVVQHGDGPFQFCGPAGSALWQRWFEGDRDFTDAFGNKLRVLAVANPKFTFAEYRKARPGRSQDFGQRSLKREGYGIIRVDRKVRQFVLECWPLQVHDPLAPGAKQFEGWPVRVPF